MAGRTQPRMSAPLAPRRAALTREEALTQAQRDLDHVMGDWLYEGNSITGVHGRYPVVCFCSVCGDRLDADGTGPVLARMYPGVLPEPWWMRFAIPWFGPPAITPMLSGRVAGAVPSSRPVPSDLIKRDRERA